MTPNEYHELLKLLNKVIEETDRVEPNELRDGSFDWSDWNRARRLNVQAIQTRSLLLDWVGETGDEEVTA